MDSELLKFIFDRCETNALYLSKQININYNRLYCVAFYDYKLTNEELDILKDYLKNKKRWSDYFIDRKLFKIRKRNNGNTKRDSKSNDF